MLPGFAFLSYVIFASFAFCFKKVISTGSFCSLRFCFMYSAGRYVTFKSKGISLMKKSTLLIFPTVGKTF
jgi:hypothetical protein